MSCPLAHTWCNVHTLLTFNAAAAVRLAAPCMQVAALIDHALREMGGAAGSSTQQQYDEMLGLDPAAAAAGSSWGKRGRYSGQSNASGRSSSLSSSEDEAEVAGGLR